MATFRYKAVDGAGAVVEGDVDAESEAAAVVKLQGLGLLPIRASAAGSSVFQSLFRLELRSRKKGLAERDLISLTRDLATLLDAGIELERALDIVRSLVEREAIVRIVERLLEDVREGTTLADALAEHPESFPGLYVSMVRAGEAGGSLQETFSRMADYLEQSDAAREEVKSALVYPIILSITALASVFVLVGFVLPRFKPLFESAGESLPLATTIVMVVGDAVQSYWWLILVGVIVFLLGLRSAGRIPSARLRMDGWILRLPVIGALLTKLETARLTRTLGTLLVNGVPMLSALDIAQRTNENRAFVDGLSAIPDAVKAGRRLSEELDGASVFPRLGSHLVRVGEESGQLESMLLKTADIYDEETRRSVKRAVAILTPAVTIILGLLIAGIIASILVAILSLNEIAF